MKGINTSMKQLLSCIAGGTVTAIIYAVLLFFFVIGTFSLSGETLSQKENRDTFVFFSLVIILLLTVYVTIRQYLSGKKFTATGIAAVGLLAIYGVFYTGKIYFSNLDYYQGFDKAIWVESRFKPFKMAKTLVKKNKLSMLSKQEILDLLGLPENDCSDECHYLHYTTEGNWKLCILLFDNNKVKEAYLYEEGLF